MPSPFLNQVILQCPRLQTLSITGCGRLEVLLLWSDELTELDLSGRDCLYSSMRRQCCDAVNITLIVVHVHGREQLEVHALSHSARINQIE